MFAVNLNNIFRVSIALELLIQFKFNGVKNDGAIEMTHSARRVNGHRTLLVTQLQRHRERANNA